MIDSTNFSGGHQSKIRERFAFGILSEAIGSLFWIFLQFSSSLHQLNSVLTKESRNQGTLPSSFLLFLRVFFLNRQNDAIGKGWTILSQKNVFITVNQLLIHIFLHLRFWATRRSERCMTNSGRQDSMEREDPQDSRADSMTQWTSSISFLADSLGWVADQVWTAVMGPKNVSQRGGRQVSLQRLAQKRSIPLTKSPMLPYHSQAVPK